jgi:NYN domain-containing protein
MGPLGAQPHAAIADVLSSLAVYMPPADRSVHSARAAELSVRDTLTDTEKADLLGIVVAYARSLPFGLLDEQQSAAFAEALCWARLNTGGGAEEPLEAIGSAARSLPYELLRQQTMARLAGSAEDQAEDSHDNAAPALVTGPGQDELDDGPPPVLPRRDQVESVRVLVARSIQSIVAFAAPDKREENSQFLADAIATAPPVEADEWGRLALIIGIYARNFPVPALSRVQVRRLWDATRWAVWYEYWFRERNVAARINQMVSLLQRLSPEHAAEIVEQTAPELRMIVTIAKPKALNDIADYLEAAAFDGPQAGRLLAEARGHRAQRADSPEPPPGPGGHSITPVPPSLVPARMSELLELRLTRAEAAASIEKVWEFLDPQFDEANRNRLRRGQQGEARPLADLITHACQGAERRLRQHRSTVSEEDVKTLCGLALFAAGYNGDGTPGLLRTVNLYGLYLLRAGAVGVEGYALLVTAVCQRAHQARAQIVGQALDEGIRQLDDLQSGAGTDLLEAWVGAAVTWSQEADRAALAQFVAALERRGVEESVDLLLLRKAATAEDPTDNGLSFLSEADRAAYDEHYRKAHVYEIAELLARHEASILETLSRSLAAPGFSEYRPPAKTVRVMQGGQNRFAELKRKALSGDVAQAREARDSFARASAGRKDWERRTLREWRVYAAMQVDVFDAIPEWLEAFNSNSASLEEKWNLSVFHAGQRDYATALTFLRQSVETARSSYNYLLFACYLAVQVILYDSASADAERARDFLVGNLRGVLAPEAQLLWIVLANKHRDGTDVVRFSDAIRAHRTLWDSPLVLPPPSLAGYPDDFTQRAAKLELLREGLKRLKMNRTWRLWLNEALTVPSNDRWFQVWDWAATACEDDGDINAAVNVLRRIARSSLRECMSARGHDDAAARAFRDKRISFLRRVLVRLCELARNHDRENLLKEIVDEYVTPVEELREPKGQNRVLHGYLQNLLDLEPEEGGEEQLVPTGPDALWGQLGFVMAEITGIQDLDDQLRSRIENALDIYPGGVPRGRAVALALRQSVATIWNLGQVGGRADEIPQLLDDLAASLENTVRDIERFELTSLRVLTSMMMRVVRSFAEESCSPPEPEVSVHPAWIGYPSDLEASSAVVDVSFPGPGVARNVVLWMAWEGESEPRSGTVALPELAPGDVQCLALPGRRVADGMPGTAGITVTVQYDWNFMNRVQKSLPVTVEVSDFTGFLAERHIGIQEFPDPFVVDQPLTRSDAQTSLFQGRTKEIDDVRRAFGGARLPNAPLCFYGIRRTGKTSLLRRIYTDLDQMDLVPLEVSLIGIVASKLNQMQVFVAFFDRVQRAVNAHYPDVGFAPDIPADHPNPLLLVEDFFEQLAAAFADRGRLVLLLDEFQVLIAPAGEPLLDSLRPICERGLVGLIVFANQGHDVMINMPGQLAVQSLRVDFLSEAETAEAVRGPLEPLGVATPASTLRFLYEYTAGHPNFTMKLAKAGLAALNLEHRNVLTRNDIEDAAREVLRTSGLFTTSWFSNKNLTPVEEDTAIKVAKIGEIGSGLAGDDERLRQFDDTVLRNLDHKRVLQASGGRIRVRGRLLEEYLRGLIGEVAPPASPPGVSDRVGLFVDLENIIGHIPPSMSFYEAGLAMQQFAARFGELKVRFAVAAPWNIQGWHEVKLGLESSGIRVSEVSHRLQQRGVSKANLADMYLNDQINEEVDDKELTAIVIATGDKDFLGMIEKYFDRGIQVRILGGSSGSTARLYTDLAKERRRHAFALGRLEADFHVSFLEELFAPPP